MKALAIPTMAHATWIILAMRIIADGIVNVLKGKEVVTLKANVKMV